MRNINIKIGAAVMSSAMLLSFTACALKQPVYTAASTNGDNTANTSVTSAGTSASESGMDKVYAYSSLLACLENLEIQVEKYNWMNVGHEDSNWAFPTDNIPCALVDLTGDGVEELIVMEGQSDLSATLEVYSYDANAKDSSVILKVEALNMQAETARGVVVGVNKEGNLIIIDCPRNENEYMTCIVYKYDGKELVPVESAAFFLSYTDDAANSYKNYKINDESVTEQEYKAKADGIINSIDQLLQYAFVCGDQLKTKVSSLNSNAMSYEAMHEYLKGKIN